MKYNLTRNLIFFITLIKVIYIYKCKYILDFEYMELNPSCHWMWFPRDSAIWFSERGVIGSQRPGNFCLLVFFCWNEFSHKNQPYACCLLLQSLNPPPHQVHQELIFYQNSRGDEYEVSEQDKNRAGFYCKVQGWRVVYYHKGGKEQEDDKRGDMMCTLIGG